MNTKKVYQSITKIVESYKAKLANQSEEEFTLTPPIGGWSYSEVYSHIFDASLISLMALNNCIKGEGENKPTHFAVKIILFFGSFPPNKKYKVPTRLMERVKKINLIAAQQLIIDFEIQMAKTLPQIAHTNVKIKTKHPRLGYLNAKQWFKFIEIHLHHHLKQLNRIENSLAKP